MYLLMALFPLSSILPPTPLATSLWTQAGRTAIAAPERAHEEQVLLKRRK